MTKNILVVEDDKNIRGDLVAMLEEEGFIVDALPNGKLVLETIMNKQFAVVLCDIMMPRMDGYEVLQLMRKNLKPTERPLFIFLSAQAENSDFRKGMEHGADDYLTKPYKLQELLNAIHTQVTKRNELIINEPSDEALVKEIEEKVSVKPNSDNTSLAYSGNVTISSKTKTKMLNICDIVFIQEEGDYTLVNVLDHQQVLALQTMDTWVKSLPEEEFLQIHRSIIINTKYIFKVEKWFNYTYKVYLRSVNKPFIISQHISRIFRNKTK